VWILIDNLPAPVALLLQTRWPGARIERVAETQGGFSNLTRSLDLDGRPLILKAASAPVKRRDLRREAAALALLRGSPLPAPAMLELLEGEGWTIELQERLPGQNALQHLAGPIETTLAIYAALGALLAQLHRLPPPAAPSDLLPDLARAAAAQLGALDLAGDLAAPIARALDWASSPARACRLVHGDPGAHNLLWDAGLTALLDWEWSGLGDPITDVAWVCWTIRFRRLPPAVADAFLAAYGGPPADEGAARQAVLAQIAQILLRVRDTPAPRDEWLRRLAWTLALPQIL
jgi:aminoglycoside phosphotransferase (APT) family kinase protein